MAHVSFLSLSDAKMDIITSKQDVKVGEELLLFCKGQFSFCNLNTADFYVWVHRACGTYRF